LGRNRKSADSFAGLPISSVENQRQTLLNWYAKASRELPWRGSTDPYPIWISEIMLQQTQVKTVIPYYHRWLAEFPTIEALATADLLQAMVKALAIYPRDETERSVRLSNFSCEFWLTPAMILP